MDEILLAEREALFKQTAKERAIKHLELCQDIHAILALELGKFLQASQGSEMPMVTKLTDLSKVADTLVKLNRLVSGEATERVESTEDYSKLSLQEKLVLADLLAKASKKD